MLKWQKKASDADTFLANINGVMDLLDSEISLQEKAASRHIQLETLWRRKTSRAQERAKDQKIRKKAQKSRKRSR